MTVNKDSITTTIGIIAFIVGTLTAYDFIDSKVGGAVSACCIGLNGFLTNKPPETTIAPPPRTNKT